MIHARWDCPKCQKLLVADPLPLGSEVACDQCDWKETARADAVDGNQVRVCPLCGTDELYLQKDFPERIGIALVVAGVVIATIFWAYYSWTGAMGTLVFFFAVDWVLFHTRKDVTVCYRCLAQYRNNVIHPSHRAFDLGIGERYRQERIRRQSLPENR